MDKETLSHYGWIVVLVLVLAVLLALASPLGMFVADGFKASYTGFDMVGDNALNIISPHVHDYKETITKEPTCTEAGEKRFECSCGDYYTEELPPQHEWDSTGLKCNECKEQFIAYQFTSSDFDAKMGTTTSTDPVVTVPLFFEYNGEKYKTVAVGREAFSYNKNITKVIVSDGIESIGYLAFTGCTNLVDVELPESIKSIGQFAFENNGFTEFRVPSKVSSLTNFLSHHNMKTIDLNNVTNIGYRSFMACESLTSVDLSKVESIDQLTFYGCTSIEHIKLSDNLKYIGSESFKRLYALKSVEYKGTIYTNREDLMDALIANNVNYYFNYKQSPLTRDKEIFADTGLPFAKEGRYQVIETDHYPYKNGQVNAIIGQWNYPNATSVDIYIEHEMAWGNITVIEGHEYRPDDTQFVQYYLSPNGITTNKSSFSGYNGGIQIDYFANVDMTSGTVILNSSSPRDERYGAAVVIVPNYDNENHNHVFTEATCMKLSTCTICGLEKGRLANHKGGTPTCSNLAICSVCNKEYGALISHKTEGDECSVCGAKCKVMETEHNYTNNMNYVVLGAWDYSDAKSVNITIEYQTESISFDWLSLTKGNDYTTGSSQSTTREYLATDGTIKSTTATDSSVKFGGNTRTIKSFTNVDMLTGSAIFRSDGSTVGWGAKITVTPNY